MRDDISDKLVHLTKGIGVDPLMHREEAARTLDKILKDQALLGGTGFIKGKHQCVCFSEAPISKLSQILAVRDSNAFKYQPYGLIVSKKWLFARGGRPVIYGPANEYNMLPNAMKYRHVRFYLSKKYDVDHSWEREWRIKTDTLKFTAEDVTVVVPDRVAKEAFQVSGHDAWHYIALSDLGVKIDRL
jgi:hypothetical protein